MMMIECLLLFFIIDMFLLFAAAIFVAFCLDVFDNLANGRDRLFILMDIVF